MPRSTLDTTTDILATTIADAMKLTGDAHFNTARRLETALKAFAVAVRNMPPDITTNENVPHPTE